MACETRVSSVVRHYHGGRVAVAAMPKPSRELPVALVSGASSGIGRALALQLAAAGHAVVGVARRPAPLDELVAAITAAGGTALAIVADCTDAAAVERALHIANAWRGRLDLVVANAGVYHRGPADELTAAALQQALDDNLWSAFHLAAGALPHLRRSRGQLWFVNSFDAKKGLPLDSAYVAAKCALAGYAATLRQALRPAGVHIGSVFPGRVDTPMLTGLQLPWTSPAIPPERVASAVLRGIRSRRAEVVVPWWCRPLWWADVLSPRLGDWLVRTLRLDGRVTGP